MKIQLLIKKTVNKASLELSKTDGTLLLNKGKLFELARQNVFDDGYNYAKKESRSKYFGTTSESEAPKVKRKYILKICKVPVSKISTSR